MHLLSNNPADAYRRVELDARIAASASRDLTRICLEEAVAALGQALLALDRNSGRAPGEPLTRAHGIVTWLASGVAPDNPLHDQLRQFYGALAALITRNMARPSSSDLQQARSDLSDILAAASD